MAEGFEPDLHRHLGDAGPRQAEEGAGVGDAVGTEILHATHAHSPAEGGLEPALAETGKPGDVLDVDLFLVVELHKAEDSFDHGPVVGAGSDLGLGPLFGFPAQQLRQGHAQEGPETKLTTQFGFFELQQHVSEIRGHVPREGRGRADQAAAGRGGRGEAAQNPPSVRLGTQFKKQGGKKKYCDRSQRAVFGQAVMGNAGAQDHQIPRLSGESFRPDELLAGSL